MKEEGQIDSPPRKKVPSKSPALSVLRQADFGVPRP